MNRIIRFNIFTGKNHSFSESQNNKLRKEKPIYCKRGSKIAKLQLAVALEKKTLTLDEQTKFWNMLKKQNARLWKACDVFNIGKTAAANILKDKKKLHEQCKKFYEKNKKCNQSGKYKIINDILHGCTSNFYPTGPLLIEEAMEIENQL